MHISGMSARPSGESSADVQKLPTPYLPLPGGDGLEPA